MAKKEPQVFLALWKGALKCLVQLIHRRFLRRVGNLRAEEIEIFEDDLIGSGTFADVYAGRCRSLDVAVKKLKNQDKSDEELETFREEIRLMRQLNHPHVVLYLGACTEPGKVQIVTEKMEYDLAHYLREHKNLTLFQKLKIAKECALGMSWLHGCSSPIIHHDLKPSNFLIDGEGRVKVTDFGLSISKPKNVLIRSEAPRGTAVYMAPEVFDLDDYDEKCDIYSYGIILWEIYTGELPFAEETSYLSVEDLCIKVADENLRPKIPTDCPVNLAELIRNCWDLYPDDRPSFTTILEKLELIMAEEAILDPTGRAFWNRFFKNTDKVPWERFVDEFCRYFSYTNSNVDPFIRCIKYLLVGNRDEFATYVHIEKFGRFLDHFGPIMENYTKVNFLSKIRNLVSQSWFYGYLSTEDALVLLRQQDPGSFLIRFSTSERGYLTISQVLQRGPGKKEVRHTRIRHAPLSSDYHYQGRTYTSLHSLVESEKEISELLVSCTSGSYFSHVLSSTSVVSGYFGDINTTFDA